MVHPMGFVASVDVTDASNSSHPNLDRETTTVLTLIRVRVVRWGSSCLFNPESQVLPTL
jgi:hypothetical protein